MGGGVSVGELAETIFDILGGGYTIVPDAERVRPDKSEVMRLVSDNRRAKELFRWQPKTSIREGLAATIDWIRLNRKEYRTEGYTV